ncbi:MAG: nucleoside diphosphate pyrophosphatase [Sphingobacteriaceae bacterium]|jgi:nudix-type nucleoside diphosphatase (YffH/AdpP family)|nr:nucleoside diphosphate pyrophosphatase [Sphingobacteriaceae bacterium]
MADIEILKTEVFPNTKYKLEKIEARYTGQDGQPVTVNSEVYHRPTGSTILLYDEERKKVLLTKQVRMPTVRNGNPGGDLVEACAGIIDEGERPEQAIIREVEEETGYRISEIRKIYEAYGSPGGITEIIHYFTGKYSPDLKVNEGGGVDKGEDVMLVEWSFDEARAKLNNGEIRDTKTIVLLQYALLNGII